MIENVTLTSKNTLDEEDKKYKMSECIWKLQFITC